MNDKLVVQVDVHFGVGRQRKKTVRTVKPSAGAKGRIPRVAKLMALAIRFDGLIREGAIADQAELARLGHVSRARVTQIMNLLNLAPDIQEELMYLPDVEEGRDSVTERDLRTIAAIADWLIQRRMWGGIRGKFEISLTTRKIRSGDHKG